MTDIYESLQSFSDFQEVADPRHYAQVPPSWSVVVAHVVGASIAIHDGRYRDVNTVSGACITAVKNAIKDTTTDFPFVFGGDTATIVLPETCHYQAISALLALRRMVANQFNLTLNVQSMTVEKIERLSEKTVQVARFEIQPEMCIALFRGGGIGFAANQIKGDNMDSLSDSGNAKAAKASLEGLSCRWKKIPAKEECILTLLVYDNPAVEGNVYQKVLEEIDSILNKDMKASNPANVDLAQYKGLGQLMREERRFHQSACSCAFLARAFEILLCVIIFKFGLFKSFVIDSRSYKASMRNHADYCKFDDMLRMVLDCTKDQANAIEFMLHDMYDHGQQLYYGVFYSSHSLMTCLVNDVTQGNHIHFMDGDNGGYAMAAKQMKAQMEDTRQGGNQRFALHGPLRGSIVTMENISDASYLQNLSAWSMGQSSTNIEDEIRSPRTPQLVSQRQLFSSFASMSPTAVQFSPPLQPTPSRSTDTLDTYSTESNEDPEPIEVSMIGTTTDSSNRFNHRIKSVPECVFEEESSEEILIEMYDEAFMTALEEGNMKGRPDSVLNGPDAFLKSRNQIDKKSKKKKKKSKKKKTTKESTRSSKVSKQTPDYPGPVLAHEKFYDESIRTAATTDTSGGRCLGRYSSHPMDLLGPDSSQQLSPLEA